MSTLMKQIGLAILTFTIYSLIWNWQVAATICIGIGFHEYSHLWAAKKVGLATKGFYLIPFIGGMALVTEGFKTRRDQAFISIMGPIGGGLLALATIVAYMLTGNHMLGAASVWMVYINLFNLLPLSILDGGQLMDTITYSINRTVGFVFKTISTVVGMVIIWHFFSPILAVFIGILGISQIISEYKILKTINHFRLTQGIEGLHVDHFISDLINEPKTMSKMNMVYTVFAWFSTASVLYAAKFYLENVQHINMMDLFQR